MLRRRRLTTAAQLADRLQVSERTIYRDVQDLGRSGVPILGEAGVGYRLGNDFDLPPLMFDVPEIQALVLGARMVQSWGDEDLRRAAQSALEKVEAVLPAAERKRVEQTALFAISFHVPPETRKFMTSLRKAIDGRRVVVLEYRDRNDQPSKRTVRPLGLYFWGRTWTLGAWCELREDFRNFRLDRIDDAKVTKQTFELRPPVTLEDYARSMCEE